MLSKPLAKFKMWGEDSIVLPCFWFWCYHGLFWNLISGNLMLSATKTLNQKPKFWKEGTLTNWRRFYPRKTCMCLTLTSKGTPENLIQRKPELITTSRVVTHFNTYQYLSLKKITIKILDNASSATYIFSPCI